MKKILITGGAGFIGSFVIKEFVNTAKLINIGQKQIVKNYTHVEELASAHIKAGVFRK